MSGGITFRTTFSRYSLRNVNKCSFKAIVTCFAASFNAWPLAGLPTEAPERSEGWWA
jgi:hypothetical protein